MDKQLTVTLKAGQQSNVAQQFKEAAGAARELSSESDKFWRRMQEHAGLKIQREQMGIAQQQQAGSFGARAQQFLGGMGGGINPMGMLGRAGLYGVAGVAAYGLANQGIKTATNVYETLNDSTMTLAQKQRKLIDDYVPFAKSLRELANAQNGLADRLNRNAIAIQAEGVRAGAVGSRDMALDSFEAGRVQRSRQARWLGAAATDSMRLSLPSGARDIAGLRAQESARAMLPHEIASLRARADYGSLGDQAAMSETRRDKLIEERDALTRRMNAAGKRVQSLREDEDRDGRLRTGQIDNAATEYRLLQQQQQQKINQLKAEENRLQDLTNQKVAAGGRMREVEVAKMRERVNLLKAEEGRQQGQLAAFGSMNRAEQTMALQAARMFKNKGYDALPPQYRAALNAVGGGERMQMEAIKSAEKSSVNDEIRAALGLGKQDLAGLQKQIAKAEVQASIQVNLDASAVADELVEKMKPIVEKAITTLKVEAAGKVQSDQVGRLQGQNARQ